MRGAVTITSGRVTPPGNTSDAVSVLTPPYGVARSCLSAARPLTLMMAAATTALTPRCKPVVPSEYMVLSFLACSPLALVLRETVATYEWTVGQWLGSPTEILL